MKIVRWMLVLVLVGSMSCVAKADSVDPKVKLQGGGGSIGLFSLTDQSFQGTVYGGTSQQSIDSQTIDFINATNQLVTEVDILITSLLDNTPALTFTVDQLNEPYFQNASVTTLGNGQTLIRFFNPIPPGDGTYGGIPFATDLSGPEDCDIEEGCHTDTAGADFELVFANNDGMTDLSDLPSNEGFTFRGSLAVPEPPTALILLAGAGLLLLLKRLW